MAQQMHGIHGALPHHHDEIDAANRAAFEESFRIIKAAWTDELLEFQGKYWRVPAGETPWDMESTRRHGAGVEGTLLKAVGGLALVGSADTVTRQLERLLERLPAKWLFAWQYNSCIPHADLMRSIEAFSSKVLPRVSMQD